MVFSSLARLDTQAGILDIMFASLAYIATHSSVLNG